MNIEQIASLHIMLDAIAACTPSADVARHATEITRFIATAPRAWSRATLDGHITASAWVLDRTRSHAALIHHRKLNLGCNQVVMSKTPTRPGEPLHSVR